MCENNREAGTRDVDDKILVREATLDHFLDEADRLRVERDRWRALVCDLVAATHRGAMLDDPTRLERVRRAAFDALHEPDTEER